MPLPTPEEQHQLAEPDLEIQELMSSPAYLKAPKLDFTDPIQGLLAMRAMFKDIGKLAPPEPQVIDSESSYTTRDGHQLPIIIYTPVSANASTTKLPAMIWYHGGGGCLGTPDMSAKFCHEIAVAHNCIILCPGYRLAPEHKFPTGLLDCWDATQYIAQNITSFNADPAQGFILGGESYGAVISAFIMLRARDEGLTPSFSGAFLSAGSYIPTHAVPEEYKAHYLSRLDPRCVASPGLSKEMKAAFDLALQPDYNSPIARAMLWPTGYKGLPKTYFQTCGLDINRDEAFIYCDVLERSGVDTKMDVYPGTPHCFWWTFPKVKAAGKWIEDTRNGMAWLLKKV